VGVLYILDEPSIGLHPRDNTRLLETLVRLRDMGNTVLVVEHDEEIIRAADHIIDMGPRAGVHGGRIVACGTPAEDPLVDGLAHRRLSVGAAGHRHPQEPPAAVAALHQRARGPRAQPEGRHGALPHRPAHLRDRGVGLGKIDAGHRHAAARPAGAPAQRQDAPGHARRHRRLHHVDKVIDIDQAPIGRTPRSNPATYTGLFTHIRDLFAALPDSKARGYKAGRYSFNVKGGRCESCQGDGILRIEMHFSRRVRAVRAVRRPALQPRDARGALQGDEHRRRPRHDGGAGVRVPGAHPQDPAESSTRCATSGWATSRWARRRRRCRAARPSASSSPRSWPRSRPAARSTSSTSRPPGLHFDDIKQLLEVLNQLVEQGNTVIVIEHNLDVVKTSDYVIDLGPEGGDAAATSSASGPRRTWRGRRSRTPADIYARCFRMEPRLQSSA
jgi:excinuclease ABC subunit A